LGDLDVNDKIILKTYVSEIKSESVDWTHPLRIGTSGGLL